MNFRPPELAKCRLRVRQSPDRVSLQLPARVFFPFLFFLFPPSGINYGQYLLVEFHWFYLCNGA